MYCPNCKDEFREGFTRCEGCNVDLVESLDAIHDAEPPPPMPMHLVDFCGFFALEDARHARDRLRVERIRSEIVIRDPPGTSPDEAAGEEYWIRVDQARYADVRKLLAETTEGRLAQPEASHFSCSECGHSVAVEESFCPDCGARFEDG